MRIDKALHLVVPVEGSEGTLFVHSTPISGDIYRMFWKPLARTFDAIYTQGFGRVGPRVANQMLREASEQFDMWSGSDGPQVPKGLLPEIHRLTSVLVSGARGWETVPFDEVKAKGSIDPDVLDEIEGLLVFFTAGWHLHRKANREVLLVGALAPWRAQISPLNCTGFRNSLPTSTEAESSGATAAA